MLTYKYERKFLMKEWRNVVITIPHKDNAPGDIFFRDHKTAKAIMQDLLESSADEVPFIQETLEGFLVRPTKVSDKRYLKEINSTHFVLWDNTRVNFYAVGDLRFLWAHQEAYEEGGKRFYSKDAAISLLNKELVLRDSDLPFLSMKIAVELLNRGWKLADKEIYKLFLQGSLFEWESNDTIQIQTGRISRSPVTTLEGVDTLFSV
jgi:hypothetical protein